MGRPYWDAEVGKHVTPVEIVGGSAGGGVGNSLEFEWDGTKLGVRVEGDETYEYQDLKGDPGADGKDGVDGDKGDPGADGKDGVDGKDAEPQFTAEEVEAIKALIADDGGEA